MDSQTSSEFGFWSSVFGHVVFLSGGVLVGWFMGGNWVLPSNACLGSRVLMSLMFEAVVGCRGGLTGGFGLAHVGVFFVLVLLNFGGLVPGGFSATSHLTVGLTLGISWWFWSVLSGSCYDWGSFLAHLLPCGTPPVLCPLMVMIEGVSVAIRPITLSVRLVANIMMGHLVLSLVGGYVCVSFIGIGYCVVGGYIMFEFLVCGLQAYVFTLLVGLYSSEHP